MEYTNTITSKLMLDGATVLKDELKARICRVKIMKPYEKKS
jgi:hypothetical protein